MKLKILTVVFLLGVFGLVDIVSSVCLVRNTAEPSEYWYQCFKSNNYLADIEAAPIDIPRVLFGNSKMEVIRNRSFTRLSRGLEELHILFSEIGKIEDDAFEGLVELRSLEIVRSNLHVVRGTWFKGLFKLKTVSFRGNELKRIEDSFFLTVPALETLDISENELTCLPLAALENFETKVFHLQHNRFLWECTLSLVDWLETKNIWFDDFKQTSWDSSMEFALECRNILKKIHFPVIEENLKKCAESRALQLLLPDENYTVEQLCQSSKDKPSPILDCSK